MIEFVFKLDYERLRTRFVAGSRARSNAVFKGGRIQGLGLDYRSVLENAGSKGIAAIVAGVAAW